MADATVAETKMSGGQKMGAKVKAVTKDHSETSEQGMRGPSKKGQLLKRSDHIKEWRDRYFWLRKRRIYYYSCEEDAETTTSLADQLGGGAGEEGAGTEHKGFFDVVGATISLFEDDEGEEKYYGFLLVEETGVPGEGKGDGPPPCFELRLCTAHVDQRDEWIEALRLASRPTWVADKDPAASKCMCCAKGFGLTTRRSHCRRCGGCMCKSCTVVMDLTPLLYTTPQKCCARCKAGAPASRFIEKVPKSARSAKKASKATEVAGKMGKWAGKVFGGK